MDLLDDIWSWIFRKHLDGFDVIRCRQASKRFKFFNWFVLPKRVASVWLITIGYNETVRFYGDRYNPDSQLWVQLFDFDLCRSSSARESRFGTWLLIWNFGSSTLTWGPPFGLSLLNKFTQLEKLHINGLAIRYREILRLPKLKVFCVSILSERESKLSPNQ